MKTQADTLSIEVIFSDSELQKCYDLNLASVFGCSEGLVRQRRET